MKILKLKEKRIPWNKGLKTGVPAHNSLQLDKDVLYDLYINQNKSLDLLVYYQDKGYDMSTWFKRDPHKLQVAKDNKINLLLVYPSSKKIYLLKKKWKYDNYWY